MRGRRPIPTARKRLAGNPGKRALPQNEPEPPPLAEPGDALEAPAELEDRPLALAEWRRLAPMLRAARQVSEADRSALLAVCLEWARYLEATKKTAELGLVVRTPAGYPITNPYISIASRALAACSKLWPELGLTPSSRARVQTVAGPGDRAADPWAEFDSPLPVVTPPAFFPEDGSTH